jgi:hypothetical protein
VINRFQRIAQTNARAGTTRLGRLILRAFRFRLRRHERRRLGFLVELMRAHDAVRRAATSLVAKPHMPS